MDYISELKRKAEFCEYGEQKEGLICDMIINGVNDMKCSEKLMEIPAGELTLDRVIQTCRQVELTNVHLKNLDAENPSVNFANTKHNTSYEKPRTFGQPVQRGQRGGSRYQGTHPYCANCSKHHIKGHCPAFNKHCDACGQKGHFKHSNLCQSRAAPPRGHQRSRRNFRGRGHPPRRSRVYYAEDNTPHSNSELEEMFNQCTVQDVWTASTDTNSESTGDWKVTFDIGNKKLTLDIDSGAQCNILSKTSAEKFSAVAPITDSNVIINGVSTKVKAFGQISLPCKYKDTERLVSFQVIDNPRPLQLLGRKDSILFGLIARVNSVNVSTATEQLRKDYADVIGQDIGCLPGEYEIKIDKTVAPVIHAPRAIPVAIRDQVKLELDNLVRCGIISPVTEPTPWVNSMICVRKKNGRVRICIDPSDLNKAIMREHYPMNSIEDIVTRLHGSKYFSTLDANMGYYQIKLSKTSSMLTTFNTPFGRYRYLRIPMGLKCSGEVFQREMVTHFGSMEGVEIVIDDILVHGKTLEEHTDRLKKVLEKARTIGLKLNSAKCELVKPEVDYVGHRLTGEGLKPSAGRVKAILEMKDPEDRGELETVLGMLAYLAKFIPRLSELTAPLRKMKTSETWNWDVESKQAFTNVKKALTSTDVLKYFDATRPVTVTVDASMKGLGAAILQENGVVAYASRALTSAEQRYAQIEKEMLAVVFGCERFHKLLYGKSNVTIETDHKPLEAIMKKPIHTAPMRIQKMMLRLQPYEFNLIYIKGKEIGLADCLSRLPLENSDERLIDDEMMVMVAETLSYTNHETLVESTKKDQQLQILKQVICQGWPERKCDVPLEVMPFWDFRDELSTYNGLIYRGERTVIPSELRTVTLKTIHSSHQGILKSKQKARELVFWPGMNKQIEDVVSRCSACLTHRNKPQREPMMIHPIPSLPWSKVGTDLFELDNRHFLILVDYYSNFIEVAELERDTRAKTVITNIKECIARYGIMDILVSDNGPQFACQEFKEFTRAFGIDHVTSSPLHPQSNGLAERSVQTIKNILKKCTESGDDMYLGLLDLRNTPRDNEIGSPMQRLMSRRAKTLIPISDTLRKPCIIEPNLVSTRLMEYKQKQKFYYDQSAKPRPQCELGDSIRIQTPDGWKPATYVSASVHPRSHIVEAGSQGRTYRRNNCKLMKTREDPHVIQPKHEGFASPTLEVPILRNP